MRIAVRVEGDRVAEAGFEAEGCAAPRAAASAAVELVEGEPFLDAARVTPDAVADALGGLAGTHATRPCSRRTRSTARWVRRPATAFRRWPPTRGGRSWP